MAAETSPFSTILQDIRDGKLDLEQRMVIAKGFLPLEPEVLAQALLYLSQDADETVREAAESTILEMPTNIVSNLASNRNTEPQVLEVLARMRIADAEILETIILNPSMSDKTAEFIGKYGPGKVIEILAGNQERMLRHPPLLDAILSNTQCSQYTRSRLENYKKEQAEQERARIEAQKAAERRAKQKREASTTTSPIASDTTTTPVMEKEDKKPQAAADSVKKAQKPKKTSGVTAVADVEEIELFEEEEVEEQKTLAQRLMDMSVADKVKLASLGSREERMRLVVEKIRLVAIAALKSPKTTEEDIESISKMKNVIDDVLREIGSNREYTKNPIIRRNLLENPRTPVGVGLNLIKYVTDRELRDLARNRNIPDAIRTTARRMIVQKEMRKKSKRH